jgi:hypothetical protein
MLVVVIPTERVVIVWISFPCWRTSSFAIPKYAWI